MTKTPRLRGFLLDEALPRIRLAPIPVKHIREDFHKGGITDFEVLRLAEKKGLTLVTEDKGFKKKEAEKKTSIIFIVGELSAEELQNRLRKVLSVFRFPEEFSGKIFRVTETFAAAVDYEDKEDRRSYRRRKRR